VVKKLSTLLMASDVESLYLWERSKDLVGPYLGAWLDRFTGALADFEFEKAHNLLQEALGMPQQADTAC